jgi:DNA invertase Pin-like site-specific DNA recombinase
LQQFCKVNNYEVVEIFTETISGVKNRTERKEISKLLKYDFGGIKGVFVWELSRLGRQP